MGMIPYRNLKRFLGKALCQPGYAAGVFMKRAGATARYAFRRTTAAMPEAVTVFLTHRCNLRCVMCGQWGEGGVTKKEAPGFIRQELDSDELNELASQLAGFGPSVTLFGGEPLLHPACCDFIGQLKRRGMHCLMITNGSMLGTHAVELVENGLDELNVSLDGAGQLHDSIRGLPGVFDTITAGIRQVQQVKKARGRAKPLVNLQCTINSRNYFHLEQMLAVARETAADSLTFHNLIFLDQRLVEDQRKVDAQLGCSSKPWEGFVAASGIDGRRLAETIGRIGKMAHPCRVDFYPNFSLPELLRYYEQADFSTREYPGRCLSPWLCAYIFPDGTVKPCLNSSFSFGNIKEAPFSEIWNSAQALRFRAELRKRGKFPACVRCTELYRY